MERTLLGTGAQRRPKAEGGAGTVRKPNMKPKVMLEEHKASATLKTSTHSNSEAQAKVRS